MILSSVGEGRRDVAQIFGVVIGDIGGFVESSVTSTRSEVAKKGKYVSVCYLFQFSDILVL